MNGEPATMEGGLDAAAPEAGAEELERLSALRRARRESSRKGSADPGLAAGQASPRVSTAEAMLMVGTALAFDGGQVLFDLIIAGAAINRGVDVIAWLTFFLWFKVKGVSFGMPRPGAGGAKTGAGGKTSSLRNPLVAIAIAFVIEFIPFLDALPAWTAAVIATLFMLRATGEAGQRSPAGRATTR